MRPLIPLITTFILFATTSMDVACGQWTAPAATYPTATYPTVIAAPIAANTYVVGGTAYVAGTANAVAPTTVYVPAATYQPAATPFYGFAPAAQPKRAIPNGVYQTQRPAYYDNPSVYTGQPVSTGQPVYAGQPVRGTIQTSYRPQTAVYSSGYAGGTATAAPITAPPMISPPMTAYPAPAYSAPAYSAPKPQREGCFGRFCRKLFGTGYASSYYRAPVTYYRPVTTLNPVSGTTVTVQQPCTAYEQQLQRNPFTTILPGTTAPPSNTCNTVPLYGEATTYGQVMPSGQMGSSGIGQVGAIGRGDLQAMPIPSIPPAGTTYSQPTNPNLSPLTGPPPTLATPNSAMTAPSPGSAAATGTQGNDLAPIGRPTLNKPATSDASEETRTPESAETPDRSDQEDSTRWKLQNPADSTAMIPKQTAIQNQPDPVSLSRNYGVAEPIRAPSDYIAPYNPKRHAFDRDQPAAPAILNPFTPPPGRNPFPSAAPPAPRSEADLSDWTELTNTPDRPIKNASYSARERAPQAHLSAPKVHRARNTKWTSITE